MVKITFSGAQRRNTFVHTGMQVNCMHFTAGPTVQNSKLMQSYTFKIQPCSEVLQSKAVSGAVKCPNCKGNHLPTSKECSYYIEQEKRMLNSINQYADPTKQTTTAPAIHILNEVPSLSTLSQRRQGFLNHELFYAIINLSRSKMEMIIEEITTRLFKILLQNITRMKATLDLKAPKEAR
ncbi:unnamed protein product [Adineta ricciae]|uniref:Uncharacterized protein n=1 Tax=Adineta ricciae TaxID=249248 RepID=A0A815YCX6_ADIRI|nr:unnamed protein product [Adineta ricciae]CAF1569107.1 unnamed protein product [Adineta ricciae]